MIQTADEMLALVKVEMSKIADPLVHSTLQTLLVSPVSHQREWFYGKPGETIQCWSVAADPQSDTGIVYSDFGFGPRSPWGLVFLSKLEIADDSGWFGSLERAFYDSHAAGDLRIWTLIKKNQNGTTEIIET